MGPFRCLNRGGVRIKAWRLLGLLSGAGASTGAVSRRGRKFYLDRRWEVFYGLIPHAMDVRESLNAALLVWGLASRLFIRVIKNPTHTKSFSSTGRERAFLRGFRKTRSFQHLLMGVLACLLKNTSSQHGGFVAFCNVSKKMRYELDSQIPGIPGSEYPGRPKWTIRCGIQTFYSGKLMRHG